MSNRWSESIKNNILDLMPFDGSPVKAGIIYKKSKLSTVTVSKYLSAMVDEGIIERVQISQKNVSYRRLERVRLQHLIENFVNEMEKSLSVFPKDTANGIGVIAEKLSKQSAKISRDFEEKEYFEIFRNDYYLIEETLFYSLISQLFSIIKKVVPIEIARKNDFYVDSLGNVVPKELVDQRIKPSEIPEWTKHIAFNDNAVKVIREGMNKTNEKKS